MDSYLTLLSEVQWNWMSICSLYSQVLRTTVYDYLDHIIQRLEAQILKKKTHRQPSSRRKKKYKPP